MKIDSTWTSVLRQIDVDLMSKSMQQKKIVYRNIILERLCVPCN